MDMLTEDRMRSIAWEVLEAWNAHDVDGIVRHLAEDVRWAQPGKAVDGKSAAAQEVRSYLSMSPDLHFDPEAFEAYCDTSRSSLVVLWSATGTMTGSVEGVPATGRTARVSGATVSRFTGDLVTDYWILYDDLDYLQQLGLLPARTSPAFKALVLGDVMVGKAWQAVRSRRTSPTS